MNIFKTSHDKFGILFNAIYNKIKISQIPLKSRGLFCLCSIYDQNNIEIEQIHFKLIKNSIIDVPIRKDGIYYLDFYVSSRNDTNNIYWALFHSKSIQYRMVSGRLHFIVSENSTHNSRIIAKLPYFSKDLTPFLSSSYLNQSDHPDIISLSKDITRFCITPYQKIKKIHDWVASNIYYDYDSLVDDEYTKTDQVPLLCYKGVVEFVPDIQISLLHCLEQLGFQRMDNYVRPSKLSYHQ